MARPWVRATQSVVFRLHAWFWYWVEYLQLTGTAVFFPEHRVLTTTPLARRRVSFVCYPIVATVPGTLEIDSDDENVHGNCEGNRALRKMDFQLFLGPLACQFQSDLQPEGWCFGELV